MFFGHLHTPKLDDKGRLFLPAKFRDELAEGLVVTEGRSAASTSGPMAEFAELTERLRRRHRSPTRRRGTTCRMSCSPAPRTRRPTSRAGSRIPPMLREYAGLDRDCVVIGAMNRVEIWDPARWHDLLRPSRSRRSPTSARRSSRASDRSDRSTSTHNCTAAIAGRGLASAPSLPPSSGAPSPVPDGDFPQASERSGDLAGRTRLSAPRTHRTSTRSASSGVEPMSEHASHRRHARVRHEARDGARGDGVLRGHVDGARRWPSLLLARLASARRLTMTEPPPRPGPARPGRRPAGARARPRPAPCSSTRPSASAATPRRSSTRCPLARVVGIDRDPDALDLRRRAARAVRRPGHRSCTRCTTRSPTCSPSSASPPSTACCSTSASPRMQLDVRERGFAYARGRAAGHADGRHRPARPRPTCSTPTPPRELARVLREYGEERFARRIAAADRPRARARSRSRPSAPARRAALRRDPGAGPAYRRTPGQAHLPGAADRGQRRARRCCAGRCPAAIDAIARRRPRGGDEPTTRSRTGWSSRPSPRATRSDVPPDLPFVPEGHEPALRLVTRGAEKADAAEIDAQPARRLGPAARRRTRPRRTRMTSTRAAR